MRTRATRAAVAMAEKSGRATKKRTRSAAAAASGNPGNGSKEAQIPATTASKAPPGWQPTYALIKELRRDRSAPVDLFGAEVLPEKSVSAEVRRFQTLIALMLSSQTTDEVVGATMVRLQAHGCSLDAFLATSDEKLHALLRGPPSVGFHNNKTKFIAKACVLLRDNHGGRVPDTLEGLVSLPGVGPKMAHIVLNVAFGKVHGIGVDTHVHRICNQLHWVKSKQPEQTRKQLEGWLPRPLWGEINLLMVGLGQEIQKHKAKLLRKVLSCSDPKRAVKLVKTLGLDVTKTAMEAELELPLDSGAAVENRTKRGQQKKRKR